MPFLLFLRADQPGRFPNWCKVAGIKVIVEGWRFLPHSYAVVSQSLCLALIRRGVKLFHRDLPPFKPGWKPVRGLMAPEAEARIAAIPPAPERTDVDAVFRCVFPYDLTPSRQGPTFVQMTAELGMMPDQCMAGHAPLYAAHRGSDAVITTPSRYCREGLIVAGADPARIVVVPHGVDIATFAPATAAEREALRRALNWDNRFVFMNVGTMADNKGLDVLLSAFAAVARRDPRALLLLKGLDALYKSSGAVGQTLKRLGIDDPAICQRIVFHGAALSTAELAWLYRAADAYVSPYLAEGFNLPVLEAAACGLPIVCTAGGPTDEFTTTAFARAIRSRKGPSRWGVGVALEPDTAHAAELMTALMEDAAFRAQAREAGPAHARAHFTWDHAAAQLLDAFAARTGRTQHRAAGARG